MQEEAIANKVAGLRSMLPPVEKWDNCGFKETAK